MSKKKPKKLRVLLLAHQDLLPPPDVSGMDEKELAPFKTELDVVRALRQLGHEVHLVGVHDELAPLRHAIEYVKPDVVFNLLEEFHDQVVYDAHVVSYLELQRAAYSGCNPRGLVLARDKALSKKILTYHRMKVPRFAVVPRRRKPRLPRHLEFPLIVKSLIHEGSHGISQASVVYNEQTFRERVTFIHEKVKADAIVEQYIEGRELYASVIGNDRFKVYPTWEIFLDKLPDDAHRIATSKAKWDLDYQKKHGIRIGHAKDLGDDLQRRIDRIARRICKLLSLDGYVRVDFRLANDGHLYFLEANPNPDIGRDEEFAGAAKLAGVGYGPLIQRIVDLGIQRAARSA